MKLNNVTKLMALGLGSALSLPAIAHTGTEVSGFMQGVMHPFTGADHLLAMFAIGLLAYRMGGRQQWALPVAFLISMLLGAGLKFNGVSVSYMEQGILLSVVVLGLMVATVTKFNLALCSLMAGGFALFHGMAHAMELPIAVSSVAYSVGFVTAAASIHVAGIIVAKQLAGRNLSIMNRTGGIVVAIAGVMLAAG